jgi:hypothetical protein
VGDTLTYTWTKNGGTFEGSTTGPTVTWRAPSTEGNYTITCEVSDGEASDSEQVVITVNDSGSTNHPPVITSDPGTSATEDEPYSYDVNATDPDVGDTLTYSLTTKPSGMTINSSTGVITWTPTSTGDYNVTVEVSDGELTDTQSFTITVGGSIETYTITASAGTRGSISPSGNVTVNQGSDKSFTITPDISYDIDNVLVDGSSVGAVSFYIFINVTQDHSISATFSSTIHNLTKDTYYNTIQAALDDADTNNTIEVSDGTYDESITFPSGKKIILQSVNGPSSTIIRGNDDSRTVYLNSSLEGTTLKGFTVTHADGLTGKGMYIYNCANLIINNCTISNNYAPDDFGGGIFNNGGTITITKTTIYSNTAYGNGGGICNYGPLTITGSTISNNSTTAYNHTGGGIHNYNGTLTIIDSIVSGNSTNHTGGGIYNCYGGTITITGSTISNNSACYYGGGIYIAPTSGTITIGGSSNTDTGNFNEFTDNYKTGDAPSADQHIRDSNGDCHTDYPYNYFTPDY